MEAKRAGAVIVLLTPARQASYGWNGCIQHLAMALDKTKKQRVTLHAVLTDAGWQSSAIKDAVSATFGQIATLSSVRNDVGSAFMTLLGTDNDGPGDKTQVCDTSGRSMGTPYIIRT